MKDLSGALHTIREALENSKATIAYLSYTPLIKTEEALALIDAIMERVPEGLGECLTRCRTREPDYVDNVTLFKTAAPSRLQELLEE